MPIHIHLQDVLVFLYAFIAGKMSYALLHLKNEIAEPTGFWDHRQSRILLALFWPLLLVIALIVSVDLAYEKFMEWFKPWWEKRQMDKLHDPYQKG